ncbi:MAG: glutathione transferase GstA [Kofleriaceae bacterium]|nr:glutathione transferase GstA [Kofleriaceae bacterium]
MTNASLTLYWARNVCSLAPHIALREAGAAFDLVRVDLRTKLIEDGHPFEAITPKRYVPALRLADGSILTELAVILHYVADTYPDAALAPLHGTLERLRLDERIHFVATELHKGFAPFTIMPNAGAEAKAWAKDRLGKRIALLADDLGDRPLFGGERFTILDAYTFWAVSTYRRLTQAELPPNLAAYVERVRARPSVKSALDAEV